MLHKKGRHLTQRPLGFEIWAHSYIIDGFKKSGIFFMQISSMQIVFKLCNVDKLLYGVCKTHVQESYWQ